LLRGQRQRPPVRQPERLPGQYRRPDQCRRQRVWAHAASRASLGVAAWQHRRPISSRIVGWSSHRMTLREGMFGTVTGWSTASRSLEMTSTLLEPTLRAFGLLPAEFELIVDRLGREPNLVELGM